MMLISDLILWNQDCFGQNDAIELSCIPPYMPMSYGEHLAIGILAGMRKLFMFVQSIDTRQSVYC